MKTFLISPPFSRWYRPDWATPVLGTFTVEPRPGFWWRVAKTFRPVRGGWVNRIGLRNPGIPQIFDAFAFHSIAVSAEVNWTWIFPLIPAGTNIELNLGCPNDRYSVSTIGQDILKAWVEKHTLSVKLSPMVDLNTIRLLADAGVDYIHFSNTLPSPRGGISGDQLREVNLPLVEAAAKIAPGRIIAGGGIYTPKHVRQYRDAGATHFSLATVCMTPWRLPALKALALEANSAN